MEAIRGEPLVMSQEKTQEAGSPGRKPVGKGARFVIDCHGPIARHGDRLFGLDGGAGQIAHMGRPQAGNPPGWGPGELFPILGDSVSPKQGDIDHLVAIADDHETVIRGLEPHERRRSP